MTNAVSLNDRQERQTTALLLGGGALVALLLAAALTHALATGGSFLAPLMLLLGIAALPVLWRRPQLSVYLLLAAAAVGEEQTGFGLLDRLPVFVDLQSSAGLRGLAVNPLELLAACGLGVSWLQARTTGRPVFGPLIAPFALLATLLVYGLVRGKLAGGDLKIALWGIRGLELMLLSYLLTASLIRERGQARLLGGVLVATVTLKSAIGLWRFVVDLHGHISAVESSTSTAAYNSLLSHEDSFFFLAVVGVCVLAYVYKLPSRERRLSLVALAITLVPLLANQRRAAIAAVVIAGALLVALLLQQGRLRPRALLVTSLIVATLLAGYGYATWNSTSLIALPAQAVKSAFQPDSRDASSNGYRAIENLDLRATAKASHWLGAGFGLPMVQAQPLPDISAIYHWYLYLPHNGLLWLGATLGVGGLAGFAYLIASALTQSIAAVRPSDDPTLTALYALGLLTTAVYLTFVLLDQGILSQRIGIYMGVQLGLLALARRDAGTHATSTSTALTTGASR